VIEKLSSP